MNPTGPAAATTPASPGLAFPSPDATRRRIHLVGCCGSGMKGLADLLEGWGCRLSGSDVSPPPTSLQSLIRRGFKFHQGHATANLPTDTEELVYSQAVQTDNPERLEAARRGIPQWTYAQMLGRISRDRHSICIAGTHGKTTTTAMTACILTDAGRNPSAIFGADLRDRGLSSWAGAGELFVAESCEYQRSFLELQPRCAAILSVEPDHVDCYRTRDELIAAFGDFAERLHPEGFLLTRYEDAAAKQAAARARCEVMTFGNSPDADWWADDARRTAWGSRFRVFRRGQFVTEIQLPVPGRHNILNALTAAAISYELGVAPRDIRASLMDFPGVRRRFECLGSWRGVTVVDDYAHHPTAVAVTLQTARELFGQRRLRVAFQPHQVQRTAALFSDFARSFRLADEVFVAPVFAARERVTDEPVEWAARLAQEIRRAGVSALGCTSLDHVERVLDDALRPGDVLITMGAGDIDRIHHAFTRRILGNLEAGRTTGPVHVAESGGTGPVFSYSA